VIDLDIGKFSGTMPWDLAVQAVTGLPWVWDGPRARRCSARMVYFGSGYRSCMPAWLAGPLLHLGIYAGRQVHPGEPGPDPGHDARHGIGRPDVDCLLGGVWRLQ
jgi:hypothetical protein